MLGACDSRRSYLAMDSETGQSVVWTEFQLADLADEDVVKCMDYCVKCSRDIPQFFVLLQSYWIDREHSLLITITEYLKKGCMEDFLLKGDASSPQRNHPEYLLLVRSWIISLLRVLDYMHSLQPPLFLPTLSVSHIYFVENVDNIKLALFPLFLSKGWSESPDCVRYLPCEAVESKFISDASEVYSLGVCVLEMLTGKLAFDVPTLQAMMAMKRSPVKSGLDA